MIVTEVNLADEEVKEIQDLNTELVTLKNLIKEFDGSTSNFVVDLTFQRLNAAQYKYDEWFQNMERNHQILTKPEYRWNVDFGAKKLQLLK